MPHVIEPSPVQTSRTAAADWHADFLTMLPSIKRLAERAFCRLIAHDREESVQACVAHSALAYLRLVELGKPQLGHAGSLARYAVKQHRAGRKVGGHTNTRDVASAACQCRWDFSVEPADAWQLTLVEDRRASPAELAALRIDMADWLLGQGQERRTCTPRVYAST